MKVTVFRMMISAALVFWSSSLVLACAVPMEAALGFTLSGGVKGDNAELRITGLSAAGFAGPVSCGVVADVGLNLNVSSVDILQEGNQMIAGFTGFTASDGAAEALCGERKCQAFVTKAEGGGIDEGTPFEILVRFADNNKRAGGLVDVAADLVSNAVFHAGRIDETGEIGHHLVTFKPSVIDLKLFE